MEGPSRPEFKFKQNEDGTMTIMYKPSVAGSYKITLRFQHHDIPGSFLFIYLHFKAKFYYYTSIFLKGVHLQWW